MKRVQEARSFLFVPGDRADRFDKAVAAEADVVIIDLEDAVAPDRRIPAREAVAAWLASGGRAAVRVNAVGTADHDLDVATLREVVERGDVRSALLAVVVAKAEDPKDVSDLAEHLGVPVVPLLETAVGVQRAAQLASAEGVARLAFGHLDYAVDLGAAPTHQAMLHARSTLVQASRAAGLPGPVDGVTVALDDSRALDDDLSHALELGLTGKLLIHPRQVQPTHAAYRPSDEEAAWAERVLAAVEASADGHGALRIDGDMVDRPVLARTENILRRRDH